MSRPGSALDQEAEKRGTSVYFPQSVLPMLPPELSTGICSLNPNVDRLAMTVMLTFNRAGRLKAAEFDRAVIRSQARLTYDEVEQILQGDRQARQRAPGVGQDADADGGTLPPAARTTPAAGQPAPDHTRGGSAAGRAGIPYHVRRLDHLLSHQLIEEFMIAANEAVAEYLGEPSIFRVHDVPDPDKLAVFRQFLAKLGLVLPKEADRDPRTMVNFLDSIQDLPMAYHDPGHAPAFL